MAQALLSKLFSIYFSGTRVAPLFSVYNESNETQTHSRERHTMNMTTVNTKADVDAVVDMCNEEGYRTRVIKLCDCYLVMWFN